MTESREVLREAMCDADQAYVGEGEPSMKGAADSDAWCDAILDALLAHPVAVLRELEGLPCQTCRGVGERMVEALDPRKVDPYTIEAVGPCDVCGGSGKLGRDGVDKLLRGEPPDGWMLTATFPKDRYWVREGATEWEMFTQDDHGAFS